VEVVRSGSLEAAAPVISRDSRTSSPLFPWYEVSWRVVE
jgi:hypothetical protein